MSESLRRSTGFTIRVSQPIPISSNVVETNIADKTTSYTHTISAFGGYDTCSFNISYDLYSAEEWLDRLFYNIQVFSPNMSIAWEGFVNKVTVTAGPLSVVRGPFTDIGNRVSVVYSTVDTTVTPPIVGMRAVTTSVDDTESQALYGIIEKYVSIGGATDTDAEQVRDTWIEDNSLPATSQSFNSSSQSSSSVTIECLGYFHYLKLFAYNDTTSGTREISQILNDIFTYEATLNGIFSTDLSGITTPSSPVSISRYTDDANSALNRVKYVVSVGDANDDRWLFGIYADRKPTYSAAPISVEYLQSIASGNHEVETTYRSIVNPWNVLPGKWLRYMDFLSGRPGISNIRGDPRVEFIESVIFTAPRLLSHSGSKQHTLKQLLAKMGLAGASA